MKDKGLLLTLTIAMGVFACKGSVEPAGKHSMDAFEVTDGSFDSEQKNEELGTTDIENDHHNADTGFYVTDSKVDLNIDDMLEDTSNSDLGPVDPDCHSKIKHQAIKEWDISRDLVITATVDGNSSSNLILKWRRRLQGTKWKDVLMTKQGSKWMATISSDDLTFAPIQYEIVGQNNCPPMAGPFNVTIYGEKGIAINPKIYSYLPDVWGHLVVYSNEKDDGTQDNVYLFDLNTFETKQLTHLPKTQGEAEIYKNYVAWVDFRHQKGQANPNPDIYLMDLDTGKEYQVTKDPRPQYGFSMYGHVIAWRDDRNMKGDGRINGDIYAYEMGLDGKFGTDDDIGEVQITKDPADQSGPSVYTAKNGRVLIVWTDFRDDADQLCNKNCDKNIYLYDSGRDCLIGTSDDRGPFRLTYDPKRQESPVVSGRYIAWLDYRAGRFMDPDIYYYDLGPDGIYGTDDDMKPQRLEVPSYQPDNLAIDGDHLVYDDFRNHNWDVFLYDFSTGKETQITTNKRGQFYPRIYGKFIVWQDARNNVKQGEPFDDIFVYKLK